jgi:hypothetical protein
VEFFQLLSWTQYMNHLRPSCWYAPDLRSWKIRAYVDGGFDGAAHTVDVRRIAIERGRYNLPNIGVFLWSLNPYPLVNAPCVSAPAGSTGAVANQCFCMHPLGLDFPLFNYPVSQGANVTAAAAPANVPDRLLRRVLCQDIQDGTGAVYYGEGKSVALFVNGSLLSPFQIQVCVLADADGSWINLPPSESPYLAAIDPETGRVALPPTSGAPAPMVAASYCYGFFGALGGGSYPRNDQPGQDGPADSFAVQPDTSPPVITFNRSSSGTLLDAMNAALATLAGGGQAAVEINDNGIYTLQAESTTVPLALNVPPGATFELRAADGCRPTLLLADELKVGGGAGSSFYLNGFLVALVTPAGGAPAPAALLHGTADQANALENLGITHCTLESAFTGSPCILAETSGLNLEITRSIVGTLWVDLETTATLTDCIVDSGDPTGVAFVQSTDASGQKPLPGGPVTLTGCTVIGKVYSNRLSLVTDSVLLCRYSAADLAASPPDWRAPLWGCQQQDGCVRFSYLPEISIVPRTYECVVEGPSTPEPMFGSVQYGQPGYYQLEPGTDDVIRRGADDGGEMGAFHFVLAPLRETDLTVRLQEYVPVNLSFGLFYQT